MNERTYIKLVPIFYYIPEMCICMSLKQYFIHHPVSVLSWYTVYVHRNVPHEVSQVEGKIMYNTSVAWVISLTVIGQICGVNGVFTWGTTRFMYIEIFNVITQYGRNFKRNLLSFLPWTLLGNSE